MDGSFIAILDHVENSSFFLMLAHNAMLVQSVYNDIYIMTANFHTQVHLKNIYFYRTWKKIMGH